MFVARPTERVIRVTSDRTARVDDCSSPPNNQVRLTQPQLRTFSGFSSPNRPPHTVPPHEGGRQGRKHSVTSQQHTRGSGRLHDLPRRAI